MTYKEYYLSLNSPREIRAMANTDMAMAYVINPDRMVIIRQSAEEAIIEKFGKHHLAGLVEIDGEKGE
jgi:hypothetical protein